MSSRHPTARVLLAAALLVAPAARAQDDVTPPVMLATTDAVYPASEVASRRDVRVVLAVTVDALGHVTDVSVKESGGQAFDEAAIAAVKLWTFVPGRRGDRPIATRIAVPFHFAPKEPRAPSPAEAGPRTPARPPRPQAPVPVENVQVEGAREPSRGPSDIRLDGPTLRAAPHATASDLLSTAPGVYVAHPEGEAIAQRIYLRGFDAVHGQDVQLKVSGIPLNQGSHIHGQGYADLSIVIPEAVRGLRVVEGVHDPHQGDFAVAGSADFELGVEERGTLLSYKLGSFGTQRAVALWAPAGAATETFGGATFRATDGYGDGTRGAISGGALGQYRVELGKDTSLLLHLGATAARAGVAGVLRRDDVTSGRIGFYDAYPDPTARAQSAGASRIQLGATLERREEGGKRSQAGLWISATSYRSRLNFTGYTQRSQVQPTWVGRGDLIEQSNDDLGLGGHASYRTPRAKPFGWLTTQLEVGTEVQTHAIGQSQSLLKAPQNEIWDQRVDASVRTMDVGFFADALLAGSRWVRLRGGLRADLLFFDVDDRLGNFIPAFSAKTHLPGFRRTAAGVAWGPRATLEGHPLSWLTLTASYGEGFRSPQARQLEEGERAPFAKVRSYEAGITLHDEERLEVSAIAYQTNLSYDLAFDAEEGRLERVGPTTRRGLVGYLRGRPAKGFLTSMSATYVHATLDSPPVPTPDNPAPAYLPDQSLPYVPPLVVRGDMAAERALFALHGKPVVGRVGSGTTFLSPRPLPFGASSAAVFLLDAQASIRRDFLELGLESTNLLAARYADVEYAFVSNWRTSAVPSLLPARHLAAGPPRQVLFTLTLHL